MAAEPPSAVRRALPRTVVVLGFVSLLNDTASEMVTPLLPVFLTAALGAGPAIVGLVEGIAEATASLLKLFSGWLADRGIDPKALVVAGYASSNVARPAIGLALGWVWVLGLRFVDRVGKGLRTAPRDALIAAATTAANRGRAFGFHRAMDHAGAALGPLIAFALLATGSTLPDVFLWSAVPGALLVVLLLAGLPVQETTVQASERPALSWRRLSPRLKALILAAGGLALATTPEVFLVLWATTRGLDVAFVPLIWAAASAVKMLVATPAGMLSDSAGRLPVVAGGWLARVVCLLLLAYAGDGSVTVWLLFLAYAASLAGTEAAERSLVGDLAPERLRGTVFGLYHLVTGLLALPGAVLFGVVWQWAGQRVAFLLAAALTGACAVLLLAIAGSFRTRPTH